MVSRRKRNGSQRGGRTHNEQRDISTFRRAPGSAKYDDPSYCQSRMARTGATQASHEHSDLARIRHSSSVRAFDTMRGGQYGIGGNKCSGALHNSMPPSDAHIRQCWQGRTRNGNSADDADTTLRRMCIPTQSGNHSDHHDYRSQHSDGNPYPGSGLVAHHLVDFSSLSTLTLRMQARDSGAHTCTRPT